jgi:hypothetical protein
MPQKLIKVGSVDSDGIYDSGRDLGVKINANFTELYSLVGGGSGSSVVFGTTAGTAAEGNDSRIVGALPAATAASTYATQAALSAAQTAAVPQFERATSGALTLTSTHQGGTIQLTAAGATFSLNATTLGAGFACNIKNRTGSDLLVPAITGATNFYAKGAAHTKIASGSDASIEICFRNGALFADIIGDTL